MIIEEKIILETGDTAYNVVKKILPNSAEFYDNKINSFKKGDILSSNQLDWEIDIPLYSPDNLAVIVIVQELTNGESPGEVYQTSYTKINTPKNIAVISGIDQEMNRAASSIELYPNPVNNILHCKINNAFSGKLEWKIIDQRGVEFASNQFLFVNNEYLLDTSNIPNGVYYLVVFSKKRTYAYKKLIIIHQ